MRVVSVKMVVILSFLCLGPSHAWGEVFKLKEIYERILKQNEEIRKDQQEIDYAQREKKKAVSSILPRLEVTGRFDRSPQEVGASGSSFVLQARESYEGKINIEQALYSGGKSWAAIRIAKEGIKGAQNELNITREEALFKGAQLFYEILKTQKDHEAQKRNSERLQEHRRLSDLRYRVGEVTESVLLRAEAELAGAQAEGVSIGNALAVLYLELQILADLPEGFELIEPLLPEIPRENELSLMNTALNKRYDSLKNRIQEKIFAERVRFTRGEFLPKLSLEGTYFVRGQEPRSTFFIENSWAVGARMTFPIYEGGLRMAELSQAKIKVDQVRLESQRLRKEINIQVTRSSLTLEAVSRELDSRKKQLAFAKKNYEIVSKQFTFGLITHVVLLDANQTLIEAERDVIHVTYDRHLAILEFQKSVGVFLENAMKGFSNRL